MSNLILISHKIMNQKGSNMRGSFDPEWEEHIALHNNAEQGPSANCHFCVVNADEPTINEEEDAE